MKATLPVLYITEDYNTHKIIINAVDVLDRTGQHNKAKEMCYRIVTCEDRVLMKGIIDEYVNVICIRPDDCSKCDESF